MDLSISEQAVLVKSEKLDESTPIIKGYDFNNGIDHSKILDSYFSTGIQATHLFYAIEEINKMIEARNSPIVISDEIDPCFPYPEGRPRRSCTIFLGYTSNLVSSGLRDIFRFLVQHDLVDCIVTSAGGVEEDIIKCFKPTYLGSFEMSGKILRQKGLNRAGNLLIPNENYCVFEEWLMPILDKCLAETDVNWTPSKLIHRLGKEINNEESICYWAYKNRIPIFCPALTDGSLGDMLYFHSVRNQPGLRLDIVEDLRHINTMAVKSFKTGVIILGGGVEFDGSDSGARPDEAVSWGKIKSETRAIKVYADASIVFPLIVAKTFAKQVHKE